MDIRKLQRAIVDGLEDVKAQNIVVFNTEHLSPLFERVIIASGTSNRQTKALAASVRDAVKTGGMQIMRTEGEANGEWIIVDCGAAVVHLMQPSIREYYHLEEIWGGKPVKIKLAGEGRGLVKAAGSDDDDEDEAAVKKPAAKKAAAKKAVKTAGQSTAKLKNPATPRDIAPSRKTVAGKPLVSKAAPAKKAAAKKAPAKKATVITRTVGVKSGAAAAKKTAARKAPAKKTAARKTASRSTR
jgi:ribosome-associated protein